MPVNIFLMDMWSYKCTCSYMHFFSHFLSPHSPHHPPTPHSPTPHSPTPHSPTPHSPTPHYPYSPSPQIRTLIMGLIPNVLHTNFFHTARQLEAGDSPRATVCGQEQAQCSRDHLHSGSLSAWLSTNWTKGVCLYLPGSGRLSQTQGRVSILSLILYYGEFFWWRVKVVAWVHG